MCSYRKPCPYILPCDEVVSAGHEDILLRVDVFLLLGLHYETKKKIKALLTPPLQTRLCKKYILLQIKRKRPRKDEQTQSFLRQPRIPSTFTKRKFETFCTDNVYYQAVKSSFQNIFFWNIENIFFLWCAYVLFLEALQGKRSTRLSSTLKLINILNWLLY